MSNAHRLLALLLLLFASFAASPQAAAADYPKYLILQTPPSGAKHVSHGYNRGYGEGVDAPAYSYGYFGVQPRTHKSKHFGFYRNYTENSRK